MGDLARYRRDGRGRKGHRTARQLHLLAGHEDERRDDGCVQGGAGEGIRRVRHPRLRYGPWDASAAAQVASGVRRDGHALQARDGQVQPLHRRALPSARHQPQVPRAVRRHARAHPQGDHRESSRRRPQAVPNVRGPGQKGVRAHRRRDLERQGIRRGEAAGRSGLRHRRRFARPRRPAGNRDFGQGERADGTEAAHERLQGQRNLDRRPDQAGIPRRGHAHQPLKHESRDSREAQDERRGAGLHLPQGLVEGRHERLHGGHQFQGQPRRAQGAEG